ncbi:glycoside hydrolase family 95 protein [Devosia aquimaris]|uniref:glycoside hydrolase family 95 protein n=1 Tax=Devosia aquimaris TaxID=2866214 RepID=UPI001CD0FB4D|nr:glycoside hydrolase family 95 protein [Devosia sp. CJK-A8-3]
MTSRFRLDLSQPANGFTESFLLGNGQLGASVQGHPGLESFALNLDTLWSGGPLGDEPGPSPAHHLPALRAAIARGDSVAAEAISRQMQGPGWTQSYQPLGTIKLRYADGEGALDYGRCLDLATAEAQVRFVAKSGPVATRTLVSAPAQVLLSTIAGDGALALDEMALTFASPQSDVHLHQHEADGVKWLEAWGRVPANVLPNYVDLEPAVVYGTDAPAADGSVAAGMGYGIVAALHRGDDGQVRLIIAAESGFRGFDRRPSADCPALLEAAQARVKAALALPTETLVAAHRADYAQYFDRMDLDLSASQPGNGRDPHRAELFYHYGRYLMISGSRPGTQPTNLQGIWNVDVRPAWSSNYTVNINTEMNYWPAEMTGLADLAQPLQAFVADAAGARGAAAAQHYYGAAGACVHHNTDIWHFSAPVNGDPQWANWPTGLVWLGLQLRAHLDYDPDDTAYLSTVALPVWRAATAFALDLLVEHADGSLVASPSTSPENMFVTADGAGGAVSAGAAMDQEMIRELLELYVSTEIEGDRPLVERARTALARLRLPILCADGTLGEWAGDVAPIEQGHRHFSHLYGHHPGRRITAEETPVAFAGVRNALDQRLAHGSGHTGWSQAWVLCQAARLRDAALADKAIVGLINDLAFKSLMVLHPHSGWPEGNVFQIDGNFGAVAGMTELLVQSRRDRIIVLPALPPSWRTGQARGIRSFGGHSVDLAWRDGALTALTITGGRDAALLIDLPRGFVPAEGTAVPEPVGKVLPGRRLYRLTLTAGAKVTLKN